MTDKMLFCFGYGYTAEALARRLKPKGWTIAGTTRSAEKAETMNANGVRSHIWTGERFDPTWLDDATAILISAAPGETTCPAYRAAEEAIAERRDHISWIGYLSTNGVYGDHGGAWVDEDSNLYPTTDRARRRIRAEADWASFGAEWSLPVTIFRLPGIYGPGRSAIDTVRAGKTRRIYKEGQVFSRMHVDDIAAAIAASLEGPQTHDLYNLADDEPAPPQDVIEYACKLLGVEPPPLVPIDDADLSEMAKSFYADNKRVSSKRMKEALGITLAYPTYREGLEAIFKQSAETA